MNTTSKKYVHVAVGVIFDDHGRVCITRRQSGQHLAGFWEFPGGKVESGESVQEALKRELAEEIGIHFESCTPLIEIKHSYPDKDVNLDVHVIEKFSGTAIGREGQELKWQDVSALREIEFPDANIPIVEALLKSIVS